MAREPGRRGGRKKNDRRGPPGKRADARGPKRDDRRGPPGKRDDRRGPPGKRVDARAPKRDDRRPPARPRIAPPPRRVFPEVKAGLPGPPRVGEQLYTTRPGSEHDLVDELYYVDARTAPRLAGPSLVAAAAAPKAHGQPIELAFARQGFPIAQLTAAEPDAIARAVAAALEAATREPAAWAIDVWVPDADETNPLAAFAATLAEQVSATLPRLLPDRWAGKLVPDARAAFADNGLYAQVCLLPDRTCAVGVAWAREAPSLAKGGRLRIHVSNAAPSRAAMKLEEALAWLDRAPEPGDLCVDLGAAPGGWTWVLLERRCRVIAVDPANLDRGLVGKKGLVHARGDAFRFEPNEPVDWLFCDMAFRPLEVAGLLAKWARRQWARLLVANIKLPMKQKAQHLLRVRDILEDGGWSGLRVRQLYHDRDEVTFAGVRL